MSSEVLIVWGMALWFVAFVFLGATVGLVLDGFGWMSRSYWDASLLTLLLGVVTAGLTYGCWLWGYHLMGLGG